MATAGKTVKKRLHNGRKEIANDGKKTQFSKDKQPSPENKKQGWFFKNFSRDLIKEALNSPYKFPEKQLQSGVGKELIDAFGEDAIKGNAGVISTLAQINKAIIKGDSVAYFALIKEAYGLLTQPLDIAHTGNINLIFNPDKESEPIEGE